MEVQKFINKPFYFSELVNFIDRQKNFLLSLIDNVEIAEYNSLWDTVIEIEKYFNKFNSPAYIVVSHVNVEKIFTNNFKLRSKIEKKKSVYLLQKIDCNCNDCFYMIRDFERYEAHKKSYEGTGLMDRLAFGNCTKFNKLVSFIPETCQLETQSCFKHRKDGNN